MRRGFAAALALLLGIASAARAQDAEAPGVPAGPGRIEGRVLRAEGDAPVAGVEVALYALSADGVPGLRKTESDAEGRFAFDGVATDPAVAFLVGAKLGDVPYPGGRLSFAAGEDVLRTEIRVTDLSPDTSELSVGEATLQLAREPAGLRVVETIALENAGTRTYFVPAAERGAHAPVLRARLPAGASQFQMPLGVIPEGLVREGNRLAYFGPIHPGPHEISWGYVIPAGATVATLSLELTPPEGAARVVVLLPEGTGKITGGDFAASEGIEQGGRRFARAVAERPRGPLALRLELPAPRLAPGAVSVSEVQLVLHLDDAAIDVREIHSLQVDSPVPVLGTPDQPLLRIPLPPHALDLRFGTDAAGLVLVPHADGGLAAAGTLAPGAARVELGYRLASGGEVAEIARSFGVPFPLLNVFIADSGDLAPASDRLHRRRPVRTNDLTYQQLEAFEVAAGEEVKLRIARLPARRGGGKGAAQAAIGALALLGIALVVAPLRAGEADAGEPQRRSAEREEREAIYASLRDLDHDFETGKVSGEDFESLRAELRSRAAVLLRAERSPAAAAPEETLQRTLHCSACGVAAKAEHRFCALCGAPLGA